jgi:hypothetical protein
VKEGDGKMRFNLISRFLYTIELSDDPDDHFSGGISVKTLITRAAGPPAKETHSKQASERRKL